LEVVFSEPYTFITNTDNGVKLWLNEQLIIDNWTDHSATFDTSKPIELTAGQRYLIEMLWYEKDGSAVAQLFWQSPSTRRQIIPAGALSPPLRASKPKPANGATNVRETPTLRWSAGDTADKHDVYLGASHAAVESATTTTAGIYRGRQAKDATSYVPAEAPLEWGQTYYWRIDEVAADGVTIHKGNLWGFTVADYLIVDDFEDYDGVVNRIFDVWADYAVNNTGATVGYFDPPFTERTIVHSGSQSMPYRYDNDGTVNEGTSYEKAGTLVYSEADREWAAPQDWTRKGVKTLTLWFRGKSGNEASQLYVALQDSANKSAVVKHSNPASTTISTWAEWNIPLTDFTGLNLRAIKKLSIGVGDRTNPQRGGSGRLFIDDIQLRLAPPAQ